MPNNHDAKKHNHCKTYDAASQKNSYFWTYEPRRGLYMSDARLGKIARKTKKTGKIFCPKYTGKDIQFCQKHQQTQITLRLQTL